MSKKQKLSNRFLQVPPIKDFRWEELISVMDHFGFDLDTSGGGSHGHFVMRNDADKVIDIYRPHPHGIMYGTQLKEITTKLREWGVLT